MAVVSNVLRMSCDAGRTHTREYGTHFGGAVLLNTDVDVEWSLGLSCCRMSMGNC